MKIHLQYSDLLLGILYHLVVEGNTSSMADLYHAQ